MCVSFIPDKNIAMMPELVMSIAVPRSGCFAISTDGTIIIITATKRFFNLGGNALSE